MPILTLISKCTFTVNVFRISIDKYACHCQIRHFFTKWTFWISRLPFQMAEPHILSYEQFSQRFFLNRLNFVIKQIQDKHLKFYSNHFSQLNWIRLEFLERNVKNFSTHSTCSETVQNNFATPKIT